MIPRIFLSALLLAPVTVFAGEAATTQQSSSTNLVLVGLVSIILALAGVIALLAYVHKELALAYGEKLRKERSSDNSSKTIVLLLLSGMFSVKAMAQDAVVAATESATNAVPALINGIPRMDFYALSGIIGFELLFAAVFAGMIYRMTNALRGVPEKAPGVQNVFVGKIMLKLTNAVAVKDEERIVLQHDYDGIRELDNALPPWWKWGFVMTIIFAFAYMWYYQMGDGPNQAQEYATAVEKAEVEKAAYMAKAGNSVDETNVALIDDQSQLADAGALFQNTCAACHRGDGGGGVGPNLTDNYWLHGGALPEVFKSIKYGWKDKGMPEWGHNMSAKQIAGLASYIKNMSGKNVPGGKAPQGEPFAAKAASGTDSTAKTNEPKITANSEDVAAPKG